MKKLANLMVASLFFSCGDAKTTQTTDPTPSNPTPNNPTPPPTFDPFKNGFCEVSIDGGAPQKTGSSSSAKNWGDQVPWAAKFFCGDLNLIGFGDETAIPMKPGKYPFYQVGGPKVGVFGIFGRGDYRLTGEVNIETWDATLLKGTFEAKGSYGVKGLSDYKESITIKGSFENKKQDAPHRPFLGGTCELSVNDGMPQYEAGGQFAISTGHWAGPNTKNPSTPLLLNCGKYNFDFSGDLKDLPMKPGKYPVSTKNEPGSFGLISPMANPTGEFVIESWDMNAIKGSFEVKGPIMFAEDTTPIVAKGTFNFSCPYTPPGEPCLDKPK